MFIVSRQIGESLLLDGDITLTLAVVGENFADFGLYRGGLCVGHATLVASELRPVMRGVRGIVVKHLANGRLRLGFDFSCGMVFKRL